MDTDDNESVKADTVKKPKDRSRTDYKRINTNITPRNGPRAV